ncbi:putative MFS family arabinose efflux permease [Alteromonas sp. 38]|uniref:MFS transporter n=1 Tax=Alteromonas TaxID=226 RepID=UPI0012F140C3|nr:MULTISPECIES: MFS transporter [Alteromonas]CAD5274239.1 putative MFS family arabinose efflux permease [Alteromonas sp. 154]VXB59993.1 putative MFS family arabinose efflux permease [Alteromonas sp. 38]
MSQRFGLKGNVAIMASNCAGMLDLVALPLWIGVLVAAYHYDAQQAGALVTLFLIGAVCASLSIAPRFKKMNHKLVTTVGYLSAGVCFFIASQTSGFLHLAILHLIAGACASSALSMTHGTVARAENPHRLYAMTGFASGLLGLAFMAVTPNIIQLKGGHSLFIIFAGVMVLAALICALAFPRVNFDKQELEKSETVTHKKIPTNVWYGMIGISLMVVTQAMTFSFMERVANERGFSAQEITFILVALSLFNLFATVMAGISEKRISTRLVLFLGPVIQVILANIIMNSSSLVLFGAASIVFVSLIMFTHTFVFGLLAKLDTSGRALAATPAVLMIGAAIGPVLGGTIVKLAGYHGIGIAALCFGSLSVFCFMRVFHQAPLMVKSEPTV